MAGPKGGIAPGQKPLALADIRYYNAAEGNELGFFEKHAKALLVSVGIVSTLVLVLYMVPGFVNLDSRRGYIEGKLKELTGYDVAIRGKVSFSLLPHPALRVNNADFRLERKDKGKEMIPVSFLSVSRMGVDIGALDFLRGDWTPSAIMADGAIFNYAAFAEHDDGRGVEDFLRGQGFGDIRIKRSSILMFKKRIVSQIDADVESRGADGVGISGSFSYMQGRKGEIDAVLKYADERNYSIEGKFGYSQNRNYIDAELKFASTETAKTLSGLVELATPNLRRFVESVDGAVVLPALPFLDDRLSLKAEIRTTEDAIVLNNGSIDSAELSGGFSASFPFEIGGDNSLSMSMDNASVAVNLKRAKLSKFISPPRRFAEGILGSIAKNADAVGIMEKVRLHLSVKNLLLPRGAVSSFSMASAPADGGGVDIAKLTFQSGRGRFDASARLSPGENGYSLSASVQSSVPFELDNSLFPGAVVSRLKGRMDLSAGGFSILGMDAVVFDSRIGGDIRNSGGNWDVKIAADSVDLRKFLPGRRVDMDLVLKLLSRIRADSVALEASLGRLATSTGAYGDFKVRATLENDDLSIGSLTFRDGSHDGRMAGALRGVSGRGGRFDSFVYAVSSNDMKSVVIPLVKNTFLDRLISNGVQRVDIRLDGPAANPDSDISARIGDIEVKIAGRLSDARSKYSLDFSHKELKGFLYSWGWLDEGLLDYFYDGVPFRFRADIENGRASNVVLDIKDNVFRGEMSDDGGRAGISLSSPKFDIRSVLKKLKDSDAYVDLALKIIRALPYDIRLSSPAAMNYDGSLYRDLDIDIRNKSNPGRIGFSMKKDRMEISLDAEILNGRIFEGRLGVKNYGIPPDVMAGAAMGIEGGTLDADLEFKTDGLNAYQILSNLSGGFKAVVADGALRGISGYDQLLGSVLDLANITPNNILYVFAGAFKSGRLDFDRIEAAGRIESAVVSEAAVAMHAKNIEASGILTLNMMQKSLALKSVFDIGGLSSETLGVIYEAAGFFGSMETKIDTQALLPKLNISYLQKKKRDLRK
ncbi:MAG: hypothetical protein LBH41_01655 [Rickettsiales bacterium]|jgi:hypothetical protein|nr:hypothetical protein [Rickettsiales bacterium]